LTKYASAILLDPEYGFPATKRRNKKGLLLSYEKSCYGAAPPRMPVLYDVWSVRRMKEAGADCIKVLLHYTPFDSQEINDRKQVWVERVGDECCANDILFVLEILGYGTNGEDEKDVTYAKRKPQMVTRSVEEFSKKPYSVDLLKIEPPVEMRCIPGTRSFQDEQAYTRAEAQGHFRDIDSHTLKPYVFLSAGVSNPQFVETLEFAAESGSRFSGVLCGRATWQDGITVYAQHGPQALEDWLKTTGAENIERVNDTLTTAQPWHERI
jgi:tagatose 1,6-diphosphate aldolase